MARLPTGTLTVEEAPAASVPTCAEPAAAPSRLTFTDVAGEVALPALRTVALTSTASVSDGEAGAQVRSVIVRSGLGAGAPITWNSATCAPKPLELEKNFSCTSE